MQHDDLELVLRNGARVNRGAADRQRAFTALLRSPVLDRRTHPEIWPLVRVHRTTLGEWFTQPMLSTGVSPCPCSQACWNCCRG